MQTDDNSFYFRQGGICRLLAKEHRGDTRRLFQFALLRQSLNTVSLVEGYIEDGGISAQSRELQPDMPEKGGIAAKIASPQTLRILHQSMQPLQTCALDPARAIADPSRVIIEGRSDTKHKRHLKAINVLRHETFL